MNTNKHVMLHCIVLYNTWELGLHCCILYSDLQNVTSAAHPVALPRTFDLPCWHQG